MKSLQKTSVFAVLLALSLTQASLAHATVSILHPIKTAKTAAKAAVVLEAGDTALGLLVVRLYQNPETIQEYSQNHPFKWIAAQKYVSHALKHPRDKATYNHYASVAEVFGMDIPPYVAHPKSVKGGAEEESSYENPAQVPNPEDSTYSHPASPEEKPHILVSPQGEKIDASTEFPGEPIKTWKDYLLYKTHSQELAKNMEQAGMGEKPNGYAAHHIVAWNDPRAAESRNILEKAGIDIDDAANGVYLPTRRNTMKEGATYHPELHTERYYKNVSAKLQKSIKTRQDLVTALSKIRNDLKTGDFPY